MNEIQMRRIAIGITQDQLAEKLGVDRSTVTKWELGKSYPRASLLPKISEILGCTVDELFENCEEKETCS